MPINFIDSAPQRYSHLGRVRLGHRVNTGRKDKNGNPIYQTFQDPFFPLRDAQGIESVTGPDPTQIPIMFLWDRLELVFPYTMQRWGNNKLMCEGDSGFITVAKSWKDPHDYKKGLRHIVRDGMVLDAHGKPIWDGEHQERVRRQPCPEQECEYYIKGSCKPTGYLRFIVIGAERLGYYDLVCHQKAVFSVLGQLKWGLSVFGRLTDIPWLLRRGEEKPTEMPDGKGGVITRKVRTQTIEPDPVWFQANLAQARQIRLDAHRERLLLSADTLSLFDGSAPPQIITAPQLDGPDYTRESHPGDMDDADGFESDPENGEFFEVEDEPAPAEPPPAHKTGRPLPPAQVLAVIAQKTAKAPELHRTFDASPGHRGLVVAKINECFAGSDSADQQRHVVLAWLTGGKARTKELTMAEAAALLDWLLDPAAADGTYDLHPAAHQEAAAIYAQALRDQGQEELPI